MYISFLASHSQKNDLLPYYERISNYLKNNQNKIYTGTLFEDIAPVIDEGIRREWYESTIKNIKKSDVIVIEISYPSTANVGHELTYALDSGIPCVALYKRGRDPMFLRGIVNEKLTIVSYEDDNLEEVLGDSLEYALSQQDTRFNFFISPQIGNYLDWVSKNKRIPRAVYLRRLIEEDMKKNKDFDS